MKIIHIIFKESVEGIIQMYSLLREEDILEGIFQNIIDCDDTKKALSLEQQGCIEIASQKYYELLISENHISKSFQTHSYEKNFQFINIHRTK